MVDWRHHYSSRGQKTEGEITEIQNANHNSDDPKSEIEITDAQLLEATGVLHISYNPQDAGLFQG